MKQVLLIGCGFMGRAITQSWMNNQDLILFAIDPNEHNRALAAQFGAKTFSNADQFSDYAKSHSVDIAIVLVAVKPQIIVQLLPSYNSWISLKTIVISIAAGINMATLASALPDSTTLVRCMPNIPASIGEGVMACIENSLLTSDNKAELDQLFTSNGTVVWLDNENEIDAVTAISGSGPAYFYYMTSCLEKSAESLGLNKQLSKALAKATFIGSAAHCKHSELSIQQLEQSVTSAKGTTEAGLQILKSTGSGLQQLMDTTTTAARNRAKILSEMK